MYNSNDQACVTLKAHNDNTYRADSANCATKKSGVFCMMDKLVSTTTSTTIVAATTTTETSKPSYPGANLPKMPRLCLTKRKKRQVKRKSLIQIHFLNYLLFF